MKNCDEEKRTVMTPLGYEEVHMLDCDDVTVEVPVHVVWAIKQAEAEERIAGVRPTREGVQKRS